MDSKKRKLGRILCLIAGIVSGGHLALNVLVWVVWQVLLRVSIPASPSIGVIGGADGPTAIFVTTSGILPWAEYVFAALILAVSIWGYRKLKRQKA